MNRVFVVLVLLVTASNAGFFQKLQSLTDANDPLFVGNQTLGFILRSTRATICNSNVARIPIEVRGTFPLRFNLMKDGKLYRRGITNLKETEILFTEGGEYTLRDFRDSNAVTLQDSRKLHIEMRQTPFLDRFPSSICADESITTSISGHPPFTINFKTSSGRALSSQTISSRNFSLTFPTPDAYSTTLQDSQPSCNVHQERLLVVNARPDASLVAVPDADSCGEPSSLLFASLLSGHPPWAIEFERTVGSSAPVRSAMVNLTRRVVAVPVDEPSSWRIVSVSDATGCIRTYSGELVHVHIPARVSAEMASAAVAICRDGRGFLNAKLSGAAPFTFTLTVNGTKFATRTTTDATATIEVTLPGRYQISHVVDANQCEAHPSDVTSTVSIHDLPNASALSSSLCVGEAVRIKIAAKLPAYVTLLNRDDATQSTYTVDDCSVRKAVGERSVCVSADGIFQTDPLAAGTYDVASIVDANGCVAPQCGALGASGPCSSRSFVVGTLPSVRSAPSVVDTCAGAPATISVELADNILQTALVAVGDGPCAWGHLSATCREVHSQGARLDVPNASAGLHRVLSLRSGRCETNPSLRVQVVERPRPQAFIDGAHVICAGENASLHIAFKGTPPYNVDILRDGVRVKSVRDITSNPFLWATSAPGEYALDAVMDRSGCTGDTSGQATVSMHALGRAALRQRVDAVCMNQPFNLHFDVSQSNDVKSVDNLIHPFDFTVLRDGVVFYQATSNSNELLVPALGPGKYSFYEAIDGRNCPLEKLDPIVVKTLSDPGFSLASNGRTRVCVDSSVGVQLGGTGPWRFNVTQFGRTTPRVEAKSLVFFKTGSNPGEIFLDALSDAHCPSVSQLRIFVKPPPAASVEKQPCRDLCAGNFKSSLFFSASVGQEPFSVELRPKLGAPVLISDVGKAQEVMAVPEDFELVEFSVVDNFGCSATIASAATAQLEL